MTGEVTSPPTQVAWEAVGLLVVGLVVEVGFIVVGLLVEVGLLVVGLLVEVGVLVVGLTGLAVVGLDAGDALGLYVVGVALGVCVVGVVVGVDVVGLAVGSFVVGVLGRPVGMDVVIDKMVLVIVMFAVSI